MDKINKIKYALLSVILTFILSGCVISPNIFFSTPTGGIKKLKIVTTTFPQYDFAKQIGGDMISLTMLAALGADSHSYEPTPRDVMLVNECDIFICSGGESDVWAGVILNSLNMNNKTVIKLIDCVNLSEEEIIDGMSEKPSFAFGEEAQKEYDEHVWTSVKNAKKISRAIAFAMCERDKENAKRYNENLESYIRKLDILDKSYETAVREAKNKTVIFGDRFPFRYLFDDYGLKYYAAFPGCSTDSDVSAKNMLFLINKVKAGGLKAVYHIEFSARKIAETIAAETGAEPMLLHSCHTVSRTDLENGVTYIELMSQNLENLKRGALN